VRESVVQRRLEDEFFVCVKQKERCRKRELNDVVG
jgi:tRNA U34 5-methylaminomethyl-2-thiouridine-forming methyltransferase MnmC